MGTEVVNTLGIDPGYLAIGGIGIILLFVAIGTILNAIVNGENRGRKR